MNQEKKEQGHTKDLPPVVKTDAIAINVLESIMEITDKSDIETLQGNGTYAIVYTKIYTYSQYTIN